MEDDLDAALGDWSASRPDGGPGDGAADPLQLTAWQRVQRVWRNGRAYARKHWGIGIPREGPDDEAADAKAAAGAYAKPAAPAAGAAAGGGAGGSGGAGAAGQGKAAAGAPGGAGKA